MSENVHFQPSQQQIKFAEIYVDTGKKLTQEKIAADIGVTSRNPRTKVRGTLPALAGY